jgi:hypothetical protein
MGRITLQASDLRQCGPSIICIGQAAPPKQETSLHISQLIWPFDSSILSPFRASIQKKRCYYGVHRAYKPTYTTKNGDIRCWGRRKTWRNRTLRISLGILKQWKRVLSWRLITNQSGIVPFIACFLKHNSVMTLATLSPLLSHKRIRLSIALLQSSSQRHF